MIIQGKLSMPQGDHIFSKSWKYSAESGSKIAAG